MDQSTTEGKAQGASSPNEFTLSTQTSNLMMLVCAATAASPANLERESVTWNNVGAVSSPTNDTFHNLDGANELYTARTNAWIQTTVEATPQVKNVKNQKKHQPSVDRSNVSRKDKSLGLLCRKFLQKYPEDEVGTQIFLDDVARELDVERRRVYDIVNVFEGMEMLVRLAKNKYIWQGKGSLIKTLRKLKALALKMYGPKADSEVALRSGCNANHHTKFISQSIDLDFDERYREIIQRLPRLKPKESPALGGSKELSSGDSSRKEKSLGILCQKFLMLFIILQNHIVSLEKAAKILIEGEDDCCKSKTKVRRLYDIANILASMNLVEKTAVYDGSGRKAAFRWIGDNLSELEPDEEGLLMQSETCLGFTKHSMFGNGITDSKRKLQVRSMSANAIKTPASRIGLPRTLSTSNMGQEKTSLEQASETIDGQPSTIDVSRISLFRSPSRLTSPTGHTVSPNERMFREEVRRLKERYPTKMPEPDGLLQLLTACKNDGMAESASAPTSPAAQERGRRRRLLERFDSDGAIHAKRFKYDTRSASCSQSIESVSNDGDSRHSSDLLSLAEAASESSVDAGSNEKTDVELINTKGGDKKDNLKKYDNIPYMISSYSDSSDKDSDSDQELLTLTQNSVNAVTSQISNSDLGGSSGKSYYSYSDNTPSSTASIGVQTAVMPQSHKKLRRHASTSTSPIMDHSEDSQPCEHAHDATKSPTKYKIKHRSVQSSPLISNQDKENIFFPNICHQPVPRAIAGINTYPPTLLTNDLLLSKQLDIPMRHVPIAIRPVPAVGCEGVVEMPRIYYSPPPNCDEVKNAIQIIPISYPNVLPDAKKTDLKLETYDKVQKAMKCTPLLPLSPINHDPNAVIINEQAPPALKTPVSTVKCQAAVEETPSNFKFSSNIQRKLPTSLPKNSS